MNLRLGGFDERLSGGILPRPIGTYRIPRMFFANLDDPSTRLIRRVMYADRQGRLQIGARPGKRAKPGGHAIGKK